MTASKDRRLTQIGIDRLVRLKWLEKTASLCLADNDAESIAAILKTDLRDHFQTDESVVRGSIDKVDYSVAQSLGQSTDRATATAERWP